MEKHQDELFQKFQKEALKLKDVGASEALKLGPDLSFDRIAKTLNGSGRKAKNGSSGKYYCGGRLQGRDCSCCDGYCGPDNGCNCESCMKLDIKSRVLQKGYLVNKEGRMARKGETGIFYCGSKVLIGVTSCDGYCGPTNGPNCGPCKLLTTQSADRYAKLL